MKRTKALGWSIVCSAAVLIMTMATPSQAYDMGDKACRGVAGVALGLLELPGNMVDVSKKQNILLGLTAGFAKGVFMVPVRELVGVFELLTFPFELQKGYEPLIEPDYPWGYFCGGDKAPGSDKKK